MIEKAKAVIDASKDKMQSAVTYLDEDLKTYRAGKANPAVFNSVVVKYYGTMTPIPQVASISTPDVGSGMATDGVIATGDVMLSEEDVVSAVEA